MTAVRPEEVVPGLVVHMDPAILEAEGGCEINVEIGAEVRDVHYFLVTSVDAEARRCMAFPLYSDQHGIRDRLMLEEAFKSGKASDWIGVPSWYYKWQVWCIPLDSFPVASVTDDSPSVDRRRYGDASEAAFASVTAHLPRLRTPWRPWPTVIRRL